jgi:hypothetical protein
MNPSMQGKVYPDITFVVDPARVAAFREVVGQRDGVPPTFVSAAEFAAFQDVIDDPVLGLNFSKVLHGSQEYVYKRALVEGERLIVRTKIESIRQRGAVGFLALVTVLTDRDGELVCTTRTLMVERT